jgi:hypothetical protein
MSLGIHMLLGEQLLALLRRVEAGETADDVYLEMYANADHVSVDDLRAEAEDE